MPTQTAAWTLILLLLELALQPVSHARPGQRLGKATIKVPPLPVLCRRFMALRLDEAQKQDEKLLTFNANLRNKQVVDWDGWVDRVDCQGDLCDISFYGEDPYADVSVPALSATAEPLIDAGVSAAMGFSRHPYLTARAVRAEDARGIRLGQHMRIAANFVEARYHGGIAIVLADAKLMPFPTPPLETADEADVRITLQRGPCSGACPIYELRVESDGAVTFRGERFVASPGVHMARLTSAQQQSLRDAVLRADFFSLEDEYLGPVVTDKPSVVLSIHRGDREKTIRHSFTDLTTPVKLLLLEDAIDAIVGTQRWWGPRTPLPEGT